MMPQKSGRHSRCQRYGLVFSCRSGLLGLAILAFLWAPAGCSPYGHQTTRVDNYPGASTNYEDPGSPGRFSTLNFESQDLEGLTDQVMRDILAADFWKLPPDKSGRPQAPYISIDSQCFTNEGYASLNPHLITDRLRVGLNRASEGRMRFVAPGQYEYVNSGGNVMVGNFMVVNLGPTRVVDFALCGNITALDVRSQSSPEVARYHQIVLEIVDLHDGTLVWSSVYALRKLGWSRIMSAGGGSRGQAYPRWNTNASGDLVDAITKP